MKNNNTQPTQEIGKELFTPGNWVAKQSRGNNIYEYKVVSPNLKTICQMEADSKEDIEQTKANAELIASAPTLLRENRELIARNAELLEALKTAKTRICVTTNSANRSQWVKNELKMIDAAIENNQQGN